MRSLLVGLALASMMIAASASTRDLLSYAFPYCRCDDYSPDSSPYKFDVYSETTKGSEYTICFSLSGKASGSWSKSAKCSGILEKSLERIEFFSKAECKNSIKKVTWKGADYPKARTIFFDGKDGGAAIKLTKLGLDYSSASGQICITSSGPCNSFETLLGDDKCFITSVAESGNHECCPVQKWCEAPKPSPVPSPRPSPVPSPVPSPIPKLTDFPHRCYPGNSVAGGGDGSGIEKTPIKLVMGSASEASNGKRYCVKLEGKTGSGKCAQMPIEKFEMVTSGEQCRGALVDLEIGGKKASTSYGVQDGKFVAKFTNLGWTSSSAAGKEICFTLLSSKTGCNSFAKLAGEAGALQYAYYNGNAYKNDCCGTSALYD